MVTKISWGDSGLSSEASMVWVRVWEQEVVPSETDEENQECGEGQEPGERGLSVAELWVRRILRYAGSGLEWADEMKT